MDITFLKRWQTSEDGLGRYSLRKYIVAVKHVDEDWENCENWKEIEIAREKYNDGTHEMFTGRDKYNLILYLKQRRIKARPRRYFGVYL